MAGVPRRDVRRRLQHRLDRVLQRLHVLEGLLVAYLNVDEVIEIIRNEEDPKAALMARFDLSDTQAEAILDLRLRRLARLEEIAIQEEQQRLDTERRQLEKVLSSPRRLQTLIRKELQKDADTYGDGQGNRRWSSGCRRRRWRKTPCCRANR